MHYNKVQTEQIDMSLYLFEIYSKIPLLGPQFGLPISGLMCGTVLILNTLRKHAYLNILKNLQFSNKTIWGGSNEYPQSMFLVE